MKILATILSVLFMLSTGFVLDWFVHDYLRTIWNALAHTLVILFLIGLGVKAVREFYKDYL